MATMAAAPTGDHVDENDAWTIAFRALSAFPGTACAMLREAGFTADDLRPPPVSRSTRPARNHLLRCLGELHVVFTRMELVWSKVEVSLDAVLKRSEALEVLLGFADTPALKGRLDVRLAKFKAFWSGLAEWDLDVAVPGIASSAAA